MLLPSSYNSLALLSEALLRDWRDYTESCRAETALSNRRLSILASPYFEQGFHHLHGCPTASEANHRFASLIEGTACIANIVPAWNTVPDLLRQLKKQDLGCRKGASP